MRFKFFAVLAFTWYQHAYAGDEVTVNVHSDALAKAFDCTTTFKIPTGVKIPTVFLGLCLNSFLLKKGINTILIIHETNTLMFR